MFYNLSRKEREKEQGKDRIQKPLSTPNNDTDDTLSDLTKSSKRKSPWGFFELSTVVFLICDILFL